MHADIPVSDADERGVDRLLGLVTEAVVAVRAHAAGVREPREGREGERRRRLAAELVGGAFSLAKWKRKTPNPVGSVQFFGEPAIRERLVVEGRHLGVARRAVERDGLAEYVAGLQAGLL